MYGPGSSGGGRGGGRENRQFTVIKLCCINILLHLNLNLHVCQPRGQMSGGANQRPPLSDLPPSNDLLSIFITCFIFLFLRYETNV